jgi:hypothetical protein
MTTPTTLSQLSIDELRERIIRLSMQAIHTNSEADREAARTYQQEWSRRYAPPSALPQVGDIYWRRYVASHASSVNVVMGVDQGHVEYRYLDGWIIRRTTLETYLAQFEPASGPELAEVL